MGCHAGKLFALRGLFSLLTRLLRLALLTWFVALLLLHLLQHLAQLFLHLVEALLGLALAFRLRIVAGLAR